ncbi:hypothetical protein Bca52824_070405 [Brassica carinata]|uniref:F-box domain-containing protein n=1 Tax=Brassica carinata TaxID=52824 RepID=A0A8X7U3T6_BRACI|nr:hypothetical protein Bca52824_070405 [Brassica carinata]
MRGRDLINNGLPDELILEILQRLDSKPSRDACSLVCKRWLHLERFSRTTLRIGASFSPDTFVTLLSRRFPHATSIHVDERLSVSLPSPPPLKRKRGSNKSSSSSSSPSSRKRQKVSNKTRSGGENAESCSLTDAGLIALADGFPRIENLSLIWCPNVSSFGLRCLAQKCTSLRSLDLQGCFVGDQGLAAVGEFCKQLEELNLRFCEGLTDVGVIELVIGCAKSLKSIGVAASAKVTDLSLEAVGSHCKLLEVLFLDSECIHDKGVVAVVKGCRRLKSLKLQCVNVTDAAFSVVGEFCVSLERLALYSFQQFTDMGMMFIGKGCKNLKDLTLSDCYFVNCTGLEAIARGCKELTRIEINGCHNIGTRGLEAVGKSCPRLTELALLYCQRIGNSALYQIGKGCKSLETLHLVDCAGIGDSAMCSIAKGCRNLKKLHIRRCYEIGNKGVIAIGKNCKSLTELSLRFCDKVGDVALVAVGKGCSFLQQLNVSGCHQIGDVGISAIAKGCPQLTHLDISVLQNIGDMSLSELGEGCPMLKDLVLSHCHNVTDNGLNHLVNRCKLLETCHMVYCPGITSAGVATVVSSCSHIKKVLIEKCKVSERTIRRAGSIISYLCLIIWRHKFGWDLKMCKSKCCKNIVIQNLYHICSQLLIFVQKTLSLTTLNHQILYALATSLLSFVSGTRALERSQKGDEEGSLDRNDMATKPLQTVFPTAPSTRGLCL